MPSAEVGGDVRRNRALKLLAVGTIVDPFAGGRDPLANGNGCGMANHGYDVTIPLALARRVNRRVGAINPPATVRCHPPVPRHGRRVPIGRLCSGCARFLDLVRGFWPRGMRCN